MLTLLLVSVPAPFYSSNKQKTPDTMPEVQVAGYSLTCIHHRSVNLYFCIKKLVTCIE